MALWWWGMTWIWVGMRSLRAAMWEMTPISLPSWYSAACGLQGFGIQRTEAFIQEKRVQLYPAAGHLRKPQSQRQAHHETLATRKVGGGAQFPGLVVVHHLEFQFPGLITHQQIAIGQLPELLVGIADDLIENQILHEKPELLAVPGANEGIEACEALQGLLLVGDGLQLTGPPLLGLFVHLQPVLRRAPKSWMSCLLAAIHSSLQLVFCSSYIGLGAVQGIAALPLALDVRKVCLERSWDLGAGKAKGSQCGQTGDDIPLCLGKLRGTDPPFLGKALHGGALHKKPRLCAAQLSDEALHGLAHLAKALGHLGGLGNIALGVGMMRHGTT